MAQVIEGTADELLEFLQQNRDKRRLVLLILDTEQPSPPTRVITSLSEIEYEDGVPQIPQRGLKHPVTADLVKTLLEEDDRAS
ncbi:MAG: hypothetical protein NZM28_06225, partial [Fimbriimonadales bacterium]|nr:hypothetical protein [Fimbriimonadales bacterium]